MNLLYDNINKNDMNIDDNKKIVYNNDINDRLMKIFLFIILGLILTKYIYPIPSDDILFTTLGFTTIFIFINIF